MSHKYGYMWLFKWMSLLLEQWHEKRGRWDGTGNHTSHVFGGRRPIFPIIPVNAIYIDEKARQA